MYTYVLPDRNCVFLWALEITITYTTVVVDEDENILSLGSGVDQSYQKTHHTHPKCYPPHRKSRESVADDGDDCSVVGNSTAHPQCKHHQEKHY